MTREKNAPSLVLLCFIIFVMIPCCILPTTAAAQAFTVSFPLGSRIYKGSDISIKIIVEGADCRQLAVKSYKGKLSYMGKCAYMYRGETTGVDTIEVFMQNGKKMQKVGEQLFEVQERPMPQAWVGGLRTGTVSKGMLRAQQGVGGQFFVGGNHWESCIIDSFNFIIVRNNKVSFDSFNEGLYFSPVVKEAMQTLEHGDRVLITNIRGCMERDGVMLQSLEFVIE